MHCLHVLDQGDGRVHWEGRAEAVLRPMHGGAHEGGELSVNMREWEAVTGGHLRCRYGSLGWILVPGSRPPPRCDWGGLLRLTLIPLLNVIPRWSTRCAGSCPSLTARRSRRSLSSMCTRGTWRWTWPDRWGCKIKGRHPLHNLGVVVVQLVSWAPVLMHLMPHPPFVPSPLGTLRASPLTRTLNG